MSNGGITCSSLCLDVSKVSAHATGVAVLRGGLKNGVLTTVAPTRWRTASTVYSISSRVPTALWPAERVASAISFLSVGDQVVDVALPTHSPSRYTGTGTRDAAAGICGARLSRS